MGVAVVPLAKRAVALVLLLTCTSRPALARSSLLRETGLETAFMAVGHDDDGAREAGQHAQVETTASLTSSAASVVSVLVLLALVVLVILGNLTSRRNSSSTRPGRGQSAAQGAAQDVVTLPPAFAHAQGGAVADNIVYDDPDAYEDTSNDAAPPPPPPPQVRQTATVSSQMAPPMLGPRPGQQQQQPMQQPMQQQALPLTPVAPPSQPLRPLEKYFARLGTSYREVSKEEAASLAQQGHRVFTQANREEAGQDIYEALPDSHSLYSTVPKRKPTDPPADLYSTPMKLQQEQQQQQQQQQEQQKHQQQQEHQQQPMFKVVSAGSNPSAPSSASGNGYVNCAVQPPQQQARPQQRGRELTVDPDLLEWLQQDHSRKEADHFLAASSNGTFLFRLRDSNLALSMRGPEKVAHFRVKREGVQVYIDHGKEVPHSKFPSLDQLVDYYRHHDPDDRGGLPCQLTHPLLYR